MSFYSSPEGLKVPVPYYRPNGETVYLDLQYPLNRWCNASIEADADIAGPGTMLSFVAPAAITIFIAAVKALLILMYDYGPGDISPQLSAGGSATSARRSEHWRKIVWRRSSGWITTCDGLLVSLCDLQAFTGSSILIAGFIQGPELAFYHEEIIMQYWWLILHSFWGAHRRATDEKDVTIAAIRKVLVLVAGIFALAFGARELVRQPRDWDFLDGRQCYLYDAGYGYDDSGRQIWHWYTLVGLNLYLVALSTSLFPVLDSQFDTVESKVKQWSKHWWTEAVREARTLSNDNNNNNNFFGTTTTNHHPASSSQPPGSSRLQILKSTVKVFTCGSIAVLSFCLHQYVAYWSYADGYEPIQVAFYVYSTIYSTITLYKLKSWNEPLIDGDESSWGFGQCLPIILLAALLFSLIVTFREKRLKTQ